MPSAVQHTGVRLLLNLVEVLVARSKATSDRATIEQHRQLLQQMLVTHLAKLTSLERQVPKLMAAGAPSTLPCCKAPPRATPRELLLTRALRRIPLITPNAISRGLHFRMLLALLWHSFAGDGVIVAILKLEVAFFNVRDEDGAHARKLEPSHSWCKLSLLPLQLRRSGRNGSGSGMPLRGPQKAAMARATASCFTPRCGCEHTQGLAPEYAINARNSHS